MYQLAFLSFFLLLTLLPMILVIQFQSCNLQKIYLEVKQNRFLKWSLSKIDNFLYECLIKCTRADRYESTVRGRTQNDNSLFMWKGSPFLSHNIWQVIFFFQGLYLFYLHILFVNFLPILLTIVKLYLLFLINIFLVISVILQ